jgi:hypothetical protein
MATNRNRENGGVTRERLSRMLRKEVENMKTGKIGRCIWGEREKYKGKYSN